MARLGLMQVISILSIFVTAAVTSPFANTCSPATFSNLNIPGTRILNVFAGPVQDLSTSTIQNGNIPTANYTGLNFCNVTVRYTHGTDTINVQVWLPGEHHWNGRFQGTGGGGYITGLGSEALAPAVAEGYAAACTDGGHVSLDTASWALNGKGNVNHVLLENFASVSLNELAMIGKAVTSSFYGEDPAYSYWTGCSTGGRQGMMLAQRYPKAFDGILAMAPAINWPSFQVAEFWPQQVMNTLDYYPEPCELSFLTEAATDACDGLDGVKDGIISLPELCTFDPRSLVGTDGPCNGTRKVRQEAAEIVHAAWSGPVTTSGEQLWYGLNKDAPLTGLPGLTLAETDCKKGGSCVGVPFPVSEEWIRLFVEKESSFNTSALSNTDYEDVFRHSVQEYQSVIGTANADLSEFARAGGKILSWHGLADQLIMPNGTTQYYDEVSKLSPRNIVDFYRLFLAPGTYHCATGTGPFPYDSLKELVKWVESGSAPDTLTAVTTTSSGDQVTRQLCSYPMVQTYVGGEIDKPSSFHCF